MNQVLVPTKAQAEEVEAAVHQLEIRQRVAAQALSKQAAAWQEPLHMLVVYEPTSHVMLFALTSLVP